MNAESEFAEQIRWSLDATSAKLVSPALNATVNLLKPTAGLSSLQLTDGPIDGFLLGVSPDSDAQVERADIADVFVRGNDLVVTYAEDQARPFSLQIYWSATASQHGALVLDTVLSLQTALLESFPDFSVSTKLSADSAWTLEGAGELSTVGDLGSEGQSQLSADGANGILLREVCNDWSYAEMTHPQDCGECCVGRNSDGQFSTVRRLGGRFLEKGVIRRLRVRGVFLPRENDVDLARKCLEDFKREAPPLTA